MHTSKLAHSTQLVRASRERNGNGLELCTFLRASEQRGRRGRGSTGRGSTLIIYLAM